ncbi:shieldin complex subunit 3 [Ochotona princeps]|uniref:shieldin complex subunit 3 n=1 Tax=Ochotona princeps TaxID=9978 RepID=UPI0027146FF4|nr:shieldin complex subunit 3 [Ochotona princeps]
MTTEIILHYRPCENDPTQLSKIAEKVIQDFPTRPQSRFIPWFPYDGSRLPVKPKRSPPAISREAVEDVKRSLTIFEQEVNSPSYDCTVGLLEFQPRLTRRPSMLWRSLDVQAPPGQLQEPSEQGQQRKRRAWSVSLPSSQCPGEILPLSKKLQDTLKTLSLHSLYRARWTIEHTICNHQTLEDIWAKLNRIIRHNELPSCNATIQRHLSQIWVFCDIIYCEYVGNLLKKRLALTGKINLFVHKYGVIFSM